MIRSGEISLVHSIARCDTKRAWLTTFYSLAIWMRASYVVLAACDARHVTERENMTFPISCNPKTVFDRSKPVLLVTKRRVEIPPSGGQPEVAWGPWS